MNLQALFWGKAGDRTHNGSEGHADRMRLVSESAFSESPIGRVNPVARAFVSSVWCAWFALSMIACASGDPTNASWSEVGILQSQEGGAEGSTAEDAASEVLTQGDSSTANKAALCASQFGNKLTNAFGRVDGTVLAVVRTRDRQCPTYNPDHLVIEMIMDGQVYRMVTNLDGRILDKEAPLSGPPWAEGWHTDATLDYVSTLGVQASAFTPHPTEETEKLITDQIEVGGKVSVYATSSGGSWAGSAHLIHRNRPNKDGAIVIGADGPTPKYLLFRFDNQNF